ncbi:MAG: hypothetical protein RIF33_14350 [Cyclobacteriaceae bacterium]
MKTVIIIIVALILGGCGEEDSACQQGEKFIAEVNEAQGSLHYDDQYETHYIRYFLPGTIDSNYKGYICTEVFPDFLFTEGMTVNFSGKFYQTDAYDDVLIAIGGESITVLEIDFLVVP